MHEILKNLYGTDIFNKMKKSRTRLSAGRSYIAYS